MTGYYQLIMLSICLFKEARSRTREEIIAVACSIRNRVIKRYRGSDYVSVVTAPGQYSSFPWFNKANGKFVVDMNGVTFPQIGSPEWSKFELCMSIASDVITNLIPDPTLGATHYYDRSLDDKLPAWALDPTSKHCINIGDFRFWISR